MSDKPNVSTSEPVLKAGAIYGSISALVVTALGVLVAVGVLSSEEAAAISDLNSYIGANLVGVGTALVGVVGIVSGLVSHIVTAFAARTKVVPTDSDVFEIVPKPVVNPDVRS